MGGQVLLVLKKASFFEGALTVSLIEERDSEGLAKYSLICQKRPPIGLGLFLGAVGEDLDEIKKSINWQREVPTREAKEIIAALEHQVISVAPESSLGWLDGVTYELLVVRAFNSVQFKWSNEPPAGWQPIQELSNTLLKLADAASMIEAHQSEKRKRLIQQLEGQLHDELIRQKSETLEFIQTHNRRCREIAQSSKKAGLTCPNCGVWSSEIRFIDKSSPGMSYFICNACGRSFRPEDL